MIDIQEMSVIDIIETIVDKIEEKTGKEIITQQLFPEVYDDRVFYKIRFTIDRKFYSEPFLVCALFPHEDLLELEKFLEHLFL